MKWTRWMGCTFAVWLLVFGVSARPAGAVVPQSQVSQEQVPQDQAPQDQASQDGVARIEGAHDLNPTVGMRARVLDVILPGPQLRVRQSQDLDAPVVLRILEARPFGDAFRYDLEYYALEAGSHNLSDYLARPDGQAADLPSLQVDVRRLLPPGRVVPNELEPLAAKSVGGYETMITVLIVLWILGLLAILLVGRRRRGLADEQEAYQPTLADRLRPVVEAARRGDLDDAGKASLERLLVAYWRRKLGMREHRISDAIRELKGHDEAGPLLRQLETWLHRPGPHDDVDVASLLEPYRSVAADAVGDTVNGGSAAGDVAASGGSPTSGGGSV